MSDSSIQTRLLINFGKLGSVTENKFELDDVEVFAKYQNSVNGDAGPTYTDDCSMTGPGGVQSPCTTLILAP